MCRPDPPLVQLLEWRGRAGRRRNRDKSDAISNVATRRVEFLERRRQAANSEEAARKDEIREKVAEKMVEIDTRAGETSSGDPVHNSSSASSTVCTWDVGVEAPSPGSPQSMSIDSYTETENESLDQNVVMEKKDNRWRINVRTEDIDKLEHHVKCEQDSKVFKHCSSATGKIVTPITSVDSLSKHGDNILVLDFSIESKLVGISFIENDQNWPIYVKEVKRV